MDILTILETRAKKNQALLGIGVGGSREEQQVIEKSILNATKKGYGKVELFHEPKELVNALNAGKLDGALRGNLPAKEVMAQLKLAFKLGSIYRAALICMDKHRCFFLAPVGIDEGIFIDERLEFIRLIARLLDRLGVEADVAIISGGRAMEDLGRSGIVDESLKAGEKLFELAGTDGFKVKHYGVLLEEAYKTANIIIAPNGIVGNLLFRTLHFLGNCCSLGATVLNLNKTFIDTSRGKTDFTDAIMLASALAEP